MPESTGALTEAVFYILLSLFKPLHGYGIMQNVLCLSRGRVSMGAGTLYGALSTLSEKGWILLLEEDPEERKKRYLITDLGITMVKEELKRLNELSENGKKVVEENIK